MKIHFLSFLILLILSTCLITYAAEPIPFDDFVKITEEALDALDEIETVFSSSDSTKREAKLAFKKFDTVWKKYKRFKTTASESTVQFEITFGMWMARMQFETASLEGLNGKSHNEAIKTTQKARDLFMKYKKDNTNKARKKTKE